VAGVSACTNSVLTAERGQIDAEDASAKLTVDGFAAGSYVYLDVERCDVFPRAMGDYIRGWVATLMTSGFNPGLYCHKHNAAEVRAAAMSSASPAPPRFWIVGGVTSDFNINTSKPVDSGIEFADLWQCPASVRRTFGGATILIDEDVSRFADPSAVIPT
jgi:hypothetical protein